MFNIKLKIDILSDAPSAQDIKAHIERNKTKRAIGYFFIGIAVLVLLPLAISMAYPIHDFPTLFITLIAASIFMGLGFSAKDGANREIDAFKEVKPDTEPDHYIALAAEAEQPDVKAYLYKVHQQNRAVTFKEYFVLLDHARNQKRKNLAIEAEIKLAKLTMSQEVN